MINIVTNIPERQEFFAKDVWTGIKFAIVPILEPPRIAPNRIKTPNSLQAFSLLIFSVTNLEVYSRKFSVTFDKDESLDVLRASF